MFLKEVKLHEFRNFHSLSIKLNERVNFFVGNNGQGKTNFLEAVYLLSRGNTFRPSENKSLVNIYSKNKISKLTGLFTSREMDFKAELVIADGKRAAQLNNKRVNSVDLTRSLPTILFSPESLSAIKEGPEQRRLLLDELIITQNPGQISLIREYSKALRQRNKLLQDLSEAHGHQKKTLEATLESLNSIFFLLATHLSTARILALREIAPRLGDAMAMITGGSVEDISVDYLISGNSALKFTDQEVFDALRKRHQELAAKEIASGRSLVGPHKHDVVFLFAGNDSRFYCSQGQQRALILALKIAQIVYHQQVHQTVPILLLDDVLSELDPTKRENLMKFVEGISAQVLITATDLTWPEQFNVGHSLNANSVFSVEEGRIESHSLSR